VLVVRVHPELLKSQCLPSSLVTKHIWKERYEDINAYERYLTRNGIAIRKFFLHVSPEEQKKRFLERLEQPHKNWKLSMLDPTLSRCLKRKNRLSSIAWLATLR
jgi:polyphosphate kinase 2 (PPK2 family)